MWSERSSSSSSSYSTLSQQLYDAWTNITSFEADRKGVVYNLTGVCVKINGICRKSTILAFYNYNRTLISELSDSELWQTIVDANYVATEEDGRQVNLSTIAVFTSDGVVTNSRFTIVEEQLEVLVRTTIPPFACLL
jgi:hypothetical protein